MTELPGGVRVVTEELPAVRSVALGMWVGTGSRDESDDVSGLSHFLEHLLFKGTPRHSAIEISRLWDGLGAAVNAATSKETTHVFARFLDEHLEAAGELMAEMLLDPAYPEIDSERDVVLEEIAMYEDEPQDKVHDILDGAIFGDHPLGRPVIGRAEVISSVPIPEIDAYHRARYASGNVVVSAAGQVDHDQVVALTERTVRPREREARTLADGEAPGGPAPGRVFQHKETEQYHLCLGGPGMARDDDRRFALAVLDAVFGGSTSSRLFTEIREKRGLAYAIGSYVEHYLDSGVVALYLGTRGDNLPEAGDILGREIRQLGEPIDADELDRAKEHVKGRLVLSLESTAARMSRNGRAVVLGLPLITIDEMIERVDAVTADDLAALATELWNPNRLSAAAIGPQEDPLRRALEPIGEALAA